VNEHFLAFCLFFFAVCALAGLLPAGVLAGRARSVTGAVLAVVVAVAVAAVLVNAGADLL
jgi:hypothetical protein